MHDEVKVSTNTSMGTTPFFRTMQGVRQGDVLSPQLFNLYLNDIPNILDKNDGVKLGMKNLNVLMYADDIALLSNSLDGLQRSLNKVRDFFMEWELNVNVEKSAFMIFGSQSKVNEDTLSYGNLPIQRSTDYCYLGLHFTCNGLFNQAQKCLLDKATKACFKLKQIVLQSNIKPKDAIFLFHTLISPICTYASEVWAPCSINSDSCEIFFKDCENKVLAERLFLNFSKFILGVNRKAVNVAVRGELGTCPLLLHTVKKPLRYNFRCKTFDEEHMVSQAYKMYETVVINQKKNWVLWFQNISKMCKSNVTDVQGTWCSMLTLYKGYFTTCLNNLNQGKLSLYSKLKARHGTENYCNIIDNANHRKALCRLRISAHPLRIETGRYGAHRIDRSLRICKLCSIGEVEDEEHFLLRCKRFEQQRKGLMEKVIEGCVNFANLSHPDQTFYLLNAEGECIRNVARFCYECLEIRNNLTIKDTSHTGT